MLKIWTDGSCLGNPGPGGWAFVATNGKDTAERSGGEKNTTNNRMELTALIFALAATQTRYKNDKCVIKSDSAYCVNMFNDWIYNWQRNGWVRQKKQPIENDY